MNTHPTTTQTTHTQRTYLSSKSVTPSSAPVHSYSFQHLDCALNFLPHPHAQPLPSLQAELWRCQHPSVSGSTPSRKYRSHTVWDIETKSRKYKNPNYSRRNQCSWLPIDPPACFASAASRLANRPASSTCRFAALTFVVLGKSLLLHFVIFV